MQLVLLLESSRLAETAKAGNRPSGLPQIEATSGA